MAEQPDFTDYNPIPYLPRPLIAWEYLRRHPDYRRAWAKADRDRPRRTEIDGWNGPGQGVPHHARSQDR